MFTDLHHDLALDEFERASSKASILAERIRQCGQGGASRTEMIALLKAWQAARDEARLSHDRLLAKNRAEFGLLRMARTS